VVIIGVYFLSPASFLNMAQISILLHP
jgi:hypothetical protein